MDKVELRGKWSHDLRNFVILAWSLEMKDLVYLLTDSWKKIEGTK